MQREIPKQIPHTLMRRIFPLRAKCVYTYMWLSVDVRMRMRAYTHTHTHWVTLCALATLGHETEQAVVPASLTDLATWWLSWDVPGGIWVRSGLCRAPRSMIS